MSSDTTTVDMNAIKTFVGQVLAIPPYLWKLWDIIDVYPPDRPTLALAHYTDGYDHYNRAHEPLRKIRGIIVDLNTGAVVASSYGYTQSLPIYAPLEEHHSPEDPNGSIVLQTEIGMYINRFEDAPEEPVKINYGAREFNKGTSKLSLGYEGVLIRVFKWNDQIFFSTHRRIDGYRSKWGGRELFYDIYKRLGGPNLEDQVTLFGDEPYSPYCHQFLVVDNAVRLATSTRDNRILYLGAKKVWDEEVYAQESGPYAWPGDFHLYLPKLHQKEEPEVFSQDFDRSMIQQSEVDVATANKFIFPYNFAPRVPKSGKAAEYDAKENEMLIDYTQDGKVNEIYFNPITEDIADERLTGGDFVILYTRTPQGETIVYRLEPVAFDYRMRVTQNDPNMYHHFVTEMVLFTKSDPRDLLNKFPHYSDSEGQFQLNDPDSRQRYWWSLYYGAIAPAYKDEVDGFFVQYNRDIRNVAKFIMHDYYNITDEEELKRINENTRRRFDNLRQIASDVSSREGRSPFGIVVSLLYKETGLSLYKMISTVRNIMRLRGERVAANV